jgi:hypothetical protein
MTATERTETLLTIANGELVRANHQRNKTGDSISVSVGNLKQLCEFALARLRDEGAEPPYCRRCANTGFVEIPATSAGPGEGETCPDCCGPNRATTEGETAAPMKQRDGFDVCWPCQVWASANHRRRGGQPVRCWECILQFFRRWRCCR